MRPTWRPAPHPDRPRDVLQALLPAVPKLDVQLVGEVFLDTPRNAHAASLRQALQPCGDIHPVAQDVVAVDDDVAHVDADTEGDAAILGKRRVRSAIAGCTAIAQRTASTT